eukprot:TRINITY_DN2800_c0_g1_i1.p1 TRINITY_DN2800_c0_g1~~TRINITY_DN2800_c0_g1_i1.p1  ORF type:complete len:510 (-),score=103.39 TRINITY_DN2800_c0_g1_i1:59-1417(-)
MYGAGYLEGYLTHTRIQQQIQNLFNIFFGDTHPRPSLNEWLDSQENWVRTNIAGSYESLSNYWKQVALIMAQYDGMMAAYSSLHVEQDIPISFSFQMLSGWGDFLDLIPAILPETRPLWDEMTPEEVQHQLGVRGHCSAIVKVLGDMSDIFMSHASWFSFAGMNRIYKHYNFKVSAPGTAARKISFSSYPGCLVSIDDFYMMDSGLVMLQTTNAIINQTLYEAVTPYSLLAWQRVRLSNSFAPDGHTWSTTFEQYNSGTYNNQYMVIDLNKFHVGVGLDDGAFWVVEQIPGKVEFADETELLRFGYFPSYNVPFFKDIWEVSGYNTLGPNNTHSMAPRAQLFRRDEGSVVDFESLKKLMRSNNYNTDPISIGDPGKAICSRFDLEKNNPSPSGCYDGKATSYKRALNLVAEAINGPTAENLPPFSWSNWETTPHLGIPNVMNFQWEVMDPSW